MDSTGADCDDEAVTGEVENVDSTGADDCDDETVAGEVEKVDSTGLLTGTRVEL